MNKLSTGLLIVFLTLSIIFVGHAEVKVLFEDRHTDLSKISFGSNANSSRPDHLDSTSFPTGIDMMILAFSSASTEETYWIRGKDYQDQIDGLTFARRGVSSDRDYYNKFGLHEQSKIEFLTLSSGNLLSFSPPGFVLRL